MNFDNVGFLSYMHYDVASIVDSQSKTSLDVINLIVDTARDIRINECDPLLI